MTAGRDDQAADRVSPFSFTALQTKSFWSVRQIHTGRHVS